MGAATRAWRGSARPEGGRRPDRRRQRRDPDPSPARPAGRPARRVHAGRGRVHPAAPGGPGGGAAAADGGGAEDQDGRPPLDVLGGRPLRAIDYTPPVASAQVKSCVLLAGLYTESGPTTVIEARPTRDHTERILSAAGARVTRLGQPCSVWPARLHLERSRSWATSPPPRRSCGRDAAAESACSCAGGPEPGGTDLTCSSVWAPVSRVQPPHHGGWASRWATSRCAAELVATRSAPTWCRPGGRAAARGPGGLLARGATPCAVRRSCGSRSPTASTTAREPCAAWAATRGDGATAGASAASRRVCAAAAWRRAGDHRIAMLGAVAACSRRTGWR